jgi:hypothetical protein
MPLFTVVDGDGKEMVGENVQYFSMMEEQIRSEWCASVWQSKVPGK